MHPRDSRHSKKDPSKSARTRRGTGGRRPGDESQGARALFTAVGLCIAVGGAVAAWLGIGRSRQDARDRAEARDRAARRDGDTRRGEPSRPTPSRATPSHPTPSRPTPSRPSSATEREAPRAPSAGATKAPDGTTYGPNGASAHESEAPAADTNLPHTPSAADETRTTVFHLVPGDTGWQLKQEGDEAPIDRFPTKKAGLDAARRLAREREPSRLVVHRVDGTIQNQFSYGET